MSGQRGVNPNPVVCPLFARPPQPIMRTLRSQLARRCIRWGKPGQPPSTGERSPGAVSPVEGSGPTEGWWVGQARRSQIERRLFIQCLPCFAVGFS